MTQAHTPGRWTVYEQLGHASAVVSAGHGTICVGRGGNKANVKNFDDSAHILAAAPDLLEACEALLIQAEDDWQIGDSFDGRGKLVRNARAAITKARKE